jgi:hypothetical protein
MPDTKTLALAVGLLTSPMLADAFGGLYVATSEADLYNQASKVVLVRDGVRTVITVVNDYRGDPREFAIVVPVPTLLERDQIHIGDMAAIEHLDAYTAPRLVEFIDPDPCQMIRTEEGTRSAPASAPPGDERYRAQGMRIEARYAVGDYDIVMLTAAQSDALEKWLVEHGYVVPDGAASMLASYIRQGMRFFVATVNLKEQTRPGYSTLRPLQVAYESAEFMLPIRLGTVNAEGPQDLIIHTLTRHGRVEAANYRMVKVPTDVEVPVLVKGESSQFYRAMFDEQLRREDMSAVFLEYAWDMNGCEPCTADPLTEEELRSLGVLWEVSEREPQGVFSPDNPKRSITLPRARNVFVTRLHVRYTAETFPEDLVLQETADREYFQARYILRHAWEGKANCEAARVYESAMPPRLDRQAESLSELTGWEINQIRSKMGLGNSEPPPPEAEKWWGKIWKD